MTYSDYELVGYLGALLSLVCFVALVLLGLYTLRRAHRWRLPK